MTSTYAGVPALPADAARNLSAGHLYTISADPADADAKYDLLSPTTPKLTGGISNGFLGAGSVLSTASDFCKLMVHLLSLDSASAMAGAQTAHMVVPHAWAAVFLKETIDDVGDALGAGYAPRPCRVAI